MRAVLLPLCLIPLGCAHGFDRDALRERLNDGTLQINDKAIAEARELRPQLKLPCRVALYLVPPRDRDWRWTPEDKAHLDALAAALKNEGVASDVLPLPEMLAGKGELKDLRLAAAQCGADVLFVVRGAAQTDSYKNFASVLNLTVVGGYTVPGSHRDTLFVLEGVLLDVDNGYVYGGVQAEGVGKIVRPTFVIEDKDSVALAKKAALAQFTTETLDRMKRLAVVPHISDTNGKPVSGFELPPAVQPTPAALRK